MEQAAQTPTFAQLKFFRDFYEFGQKNLVKDEELYKESLINRQHHKQAFLSYNSQIGKIKGFTKAVNKAREKAKSEEQFEQAIKDRVKQLMQRLEKIDFSITSLTM